MKKLILILTTIAIIAISTNAYFYINRPSTLTIYPSVIYPGDPIFITVDSWTKPSAITWDNKKIQTFIYKDKTTAVVPIDFNEKVFNHEVIATFANDKFLNKKIKITPRPKIQKPLGIPEKLGGNTTQSAQTLINNLAKENVILNNVKTSPTTLRSETFKYPLKLVFITDDYGYSRQTVNQSIIHKGTDFRAQIGTEVLAMNDGIVRIARKFTVYGNTAVIDHGQGIQTFYMHMSELYVKDGNTVKAGDIIGKSGDTGYVDAAHLHISIKINSTSIDPMTFLRFFIKDN